MRRISMHERMTQAEGRINGKVRSPGLFRTAIWDNEGYFRRTIRRNELNCFPEIWETASNL